MPNITNYDCMGGKILATKTGSLASVNLLDDALGSITATSLSTSATASDTYRYLPYGGTLSRSGTKADPMMGWVGSWGYRNNYRNSASHYVRARNYDKSSARWNVVDPLSLLSENHFYNYMYSGASPTNNIDPIGLNWIRPKPGRPRCPAGDPPSGEITCEPNNAWNAWIYAFCNCCQSVACLVQCDNYARAYYQKCKGTPGPGLFLPPPGPNPGQIAPRKPSPYPKPAHEFAPCTIPPLPPKKRCLEAGKSDDGWDFIRCMHCCEGAYGEGKPASTDVVKCKDNCLNFADCLNQNPMYGPNPCNIGDDGTVGKKPPTKGDWRRIIGVLIEAVKK